MAAVSFKSIVDLTIAAFNFWIPIVVVPLFAGIVAYRASIRTFIIAATAGAATTIIWKTVIVHYVSIGAAIPGLLANLIAFVIARRFDRPEDLHFGEDELKDARWRKYVELYRQNREKEGRAALHPAALLSDCGRALRAWLGGVVEEWLPTPRKARAFCKWSGLRWRMPYDRIAGLTLALPVVYLWQGLDGPVGHVMLGCSAAAAVGGTLIFLRQQLKWRWLKADLDMLLWGSYLLALPFAHTMGVLGAQRPVGWFILLVGGLAVPLQTMDVRSALRLWGSGVVLGGTTALAANNWALSPELAALLHGVPKDTQMADALARAYAGLPLQVLGGGVVSVIAVALLSGCREELAEARVQELLLERAKVSHDIGNHLIVVRNSGKKTIEVLNALLKLTPELRQPLRWRIRLKIKRLRLEVKGTMDRAQEGLEFCDALMTEAKDPLNHVPQMGSVHLGSCVREATNIACKGSEELSRFRRDVAEFDCCVWANQTRLIHALANLAKNAVNHTGPGDTIAWKTEKEGRLRRFWLEDTGPGIAYRDLPLLLKPGFSRRKGGHGFGLSNTKEGVEPGHVYVSSLHGCGAAFVVEMVEPTEEQLAAEKAAAEHKTSRDEATGRDIVQNLQYQLQEIQLETEEIFEQMANVEPGADGGDLEKRRQRLQEQKRTLRGYVSQFGGDPWAEPEDVDDDGFEEESEDSSPNEQAEE
ncbi:MAG: sensor histidine kinase [Myxococcota bacterium]